MSVPQLKHYNEQDIQYLKEVSRVPAPFSARRFTDSDDEVWGGLPEKPLCRGPGGEDMTRGVQSPGAPAISVLRKAAPCSLTYGQHLSDLGLSLPIWKMDLGTVVRMRRQLQCSDCNTQ